MATKTYTINVDGNAAPSMTALRKEAKELDRTLATLPAGSAEAAAALQRLADVRADMKDFRETLANMDAGERLKGVIGIANGVAGAFSVATVAAKEFGLSGGSLEEYQAKVTGLIAVVQGLDSFREALEPKSWAGIKVIFGNITAGLASARAGFSLTAIQARIAGLTIRSALVATGIGALVVALGLVVTNFDKVKATASELYQRFKPALEPIVMLFEKLADTARNVGSALTFGLIDNAAKAKEAAAGIARDVRRAFNQLEAEGQKSLAFTSKAAAEAGLRVARGAEDQAKAALDKVQATLGGAGRLYSIFLRQLQEAGKDAEATQLQEAKNSALAAERARKDAQKGVFDAVVAENEKMLGLARKAREAENTLAGDSERSRKQLAIDVAKDELDTRKAIAADVDAQMKSLYGNRNANEREFWEQLLIEANVGVTAANAAVVQAQRELATFDKAEKKKAKEEVEKSAAERLEVERNTSKLLIANLSDETQRRLEELDEQAKQEKAQVKGTAEQKKLQISLIDQNLARDRAKVQADADKARLDKAKETAQREVEILQQKELALVEVEVQAAQRNIATDGSARLFKARLQQLEAQKKAELSQAELTEEAKLAITEKYLNLAAQLEREAADERFNTIAGSIQRATQAVSGIVQSLAEEATSQLDAQIQSLQDRLSALDSQLSDIRSRIETDEKSLETAVGARRAFLIAKIEQEKKAEAALRAERAKAAAEQLSAEKERQKLQDRAQRANQLSVAVETILATVEMVRTAAKSGQFAGPAAPFVIAATAAAGVAAAVSLRNALKFEQGGLLDGPSHAAGGIRGTGRFSNVEVEGGEFIVNRKATAQFLPILQHINEVGRTRYVPASQVRFAAGGVLPTPTATSQSNANADVVLALGRIEQRLVSVEHAVMVAPTLIPKPVLRIGAVESEAISEEMANAAQQKALATF